MRLSQLAPLPVRRAVWRTVEMTVVPSARSVPRPTTGPLVIAGMFTTANGIGESARNAFAALRKTGLEPLALDTSPMLGQGDFEWDGPLIDALPDSREGMLIIYNNAPELGRILLYTGRRKRREWCIASMWAWETANRPRGWIERAALADELWFPSRFVRDAIAPAAPTRSLVAFHAVPPVSQPAAVDDPPVAPGPTVFTCYADALSSFTRKNPIGAVRAFRDAFGDSSSVHLLVKSRNAGKTAAGIALARAIGDAPNITHVDRPFSHSEMSALRKRTDVLVSLHRSEGFGLTIAEAMRGATPVISTNWSAPAEYLDDACSYLVPAAETAAEDEFGVYNEIGHVWAAPDLKGAAEQMQAIMDDPAEAHSRGQRGFERAEALFGADAFRKAINL